MLVLGLGLGLGLGLARTLGHDPAMHDAHRLLGHPVDLPRLLVDLAQHVETVDDLVRVSARVRVS